jgi:hypothetical protein
VRLSLCIQVFVWAPGSKLSGKLVGFTLTIKIMKQGGCTKKGHRNGIVKKVMKLYD